MRALLGVLVLVVLAPLTASAQSPVGEHGYVVGLGGASATEVTQPFFGASAGFNVARHILITADVGRMQDVLSDFTRQDLSLLEQAVNQSYGPYGPQLSASVKIPTNYVTGGVRVPFFVNRQVRPYVSLSGGIAHLSPKPSLKFSYYGTTEDITQDVMTTERTGCAWAESAPCTTGALREDTRPMATAGAGVALTLAHHLTFDVGYKYSTIFIKTNYLQDLVGSPHSHSQINVHRFFAGAGVNF